MASKVLIGALVVAVVTVVVVAGASFYFIGVRESNLQYCNETQDKINAIATDRAKTREQKDNEIRDIITDAVNELRRREFRCPEAFHQPEYQQ